MSEQKLFRGTAILIGANAISKLLGAVFKIPLTYILQEEGMAIFNTALAVYSMFLTLVISGFPLAISKLTAENYALGKYGTMKKIAKVSAILLCIIGIVASAILFFGANFFAFAMKDPKAGTAIRVMAPAVFFVAWGTVYKGYYQGCVNMIPTAVSQVIEAFIRLGVGYGAAYILALKAVEITSAGAVSGITVGEVVATLILFFMFLYSAGRLPRQESDESYKKITGAICAIAIPMFACSCITGALNILDTAIVRACLLNIRFNSESARRFTEFYSVYTDSFDNLESTLKMSIDGARWLYGSYSGYALTLFNLPAGIIGALGVSILPAITGSLATNNIKSVKKTSSLALKLTLVIALPFAAGMLFFNRPVLKLLFHNTASAHLLALLSPCLVFVCIEQLLVCLLHSAGHITEPFLCITVGIVIKILFNILLIPIPELNISGAAISSAIAFFTVMVLNAIVLKKHIDIELHIGEAIIKPIICTAAMVAVMLAVLPALSSITGNEYIGFFFAMVMGGTVYILSLAILNVFPELKRVHRK